MDAAQRRLVMWRSAGILMSMWLMGCGAPTVLDQVEESPRRPQFRLEGDCAPSAVSNPVQVTSFQSSCLEMVSAPRLLSTAEEYDAIFPAGCEKPVVDFSARRVLVVPARGASEWFVFTNFVNARADGLEVGLVIRPQGIPPPDSLVVLPLEPGSVELRWCHSVCVKNCDVAIP
jgi:hypothetical protein